jgi:hypothetical protein
MSGSRILENAAICDAYADDLGRIEFLSGGNIRLVFHTIENGELVCTAKIVGPLQNLAAKLLEMMPQAKAALHASPNELH